MQLHYLLAELVRNCQNTSLQQGHNQLFLLTCSHLIQTLDLITTRPHTGHANSKAQSYKRLCYGLRSLTTTSLVQIDIISRSVFASIYLSQEGSIFLGQVCSISLRWADLISLHRLALNSTPLLTASIRSVSCTQLARMAISHGVTQIEFHLTFAEPNTFHKSMLPSHKVCFLPKKYASFGNPAQLHLSSPPHRFSPNLSPRCVSRQRQSIPHKPRALGLT